MATTTFQDADTPEAIEADLQAVLASITNKTRLDPQTAQRVRERGDRIRAEIFAKHGVLDIGVPAIRKLRGELPET